LALAAVASVAACRGRSDDPAAPTPPATPAPALGAGSAAPAPAEIAPRALGLPDLAGFQWRGRGGHAAFRAARRAEALGRWEATVAACRDALAADPGHLEAAWLLAAALGRLDRHAEVIAPLHAAVAGDFGKWGHASLAHPALAGFLDTPTGRAWRRRVEVDRAAYVAALARALVVSARGELYAYDAQSPRWYRLTQTGGAVIGGLHAAGARRLVYVARQRARGSREPTLAAGIVDLEGGRTLGAVDLRARDRLTVAYGGQQQLGAWVGAWLGPEPPRGRGLAWQLLDESGALRALPPRAVRPPGPWLEVDGRAARLRAIPIPGIAADFDDLGLASSIRIERTSRVLSIPSPALIDGHTVRWSPDGARIAFVAQRSDECPAPDGAAPPAPTAAAYVADATTGALRELARAEAGLAVDWLADGRIAIAGDRGVALADPLSGAVTALDGAEGLLSPRARPRCTPADDREPPLGDDVDALDPAPGSPPAAAPAPASAGGGAAAAGAPPAGHVRSAPPPAS
jgi:hypothetical protein